MLYGMQTIQQVKVMIQRLSEVFRMEDYKRERIENVNPN